MTEDFEAWCVVLDLDSGESKIITHGYSKHEAIEAAYSLNQLEREDCTYYAQKE